jgi:branched-chain amino acid transport system ATP-binding protein
MPALLEVSHIDLYRGETQVLWDICLILDPGERVAILGSNGAGKSSFLAAVTAALTPARGEIRFNGNSLVGKRPHEVTGLGIALVPEDGGYTRTCPSRKTWRWAPSPRAPAAG